MLLKSFGYVGIRSDRLDDWASFGPGLLGMQVAERSANQVKLRMDDRRQRVMVSPEEQGPSTFGFEVATLSDLDTLAGRLEGAGVAVRRLSDPECRRRAVQAAIAFADPVGNRLEAFQGQETADEPFVPGRPISGFRTGTLGMGHAVLHAERADDLLWFYKDLLGFGLSDYLVKPFKAYFFHLNPRHHSLAIIETGRQGIHHFMMELQAIDDVGQAYDLANADPGRVAVTLGRHTNDFMTSFYARTPDDFLVEYGWGGRSIEPDGWTPSEMTYGGSLWGHERTWLSPDQLKEARAFRARAANAGLRQPVQVMDGNFEVGVGSCAWWSGVKGQG
jgi:2,3-dihydroxybiphenyl 1,2-dioxygenase